MRVIGLARTIVVGFAFAMSTFSMPAPADADGVISGSCTLEVEASFSPVSVPLPAPTIIELDGSGMCVTNVGVGALELDGTVGTTALTGGFGCAGGVATGTGAVEIDVAGFSGPEVLIVVAEVNGAVVLGVVSTSHALRFDGVAILAEDPTDAPTCLHVGLGATTWTGAMGFQDPEPPPLG